MILAYECLEHGLTRLGQVAEADAGAALAAVERAMVRIRRSQTRRTLARLAAGEAAPASDPGLDQAIDAVEEGPDGSGEEVTVGLVAERLGVDPSRASRLVARAIAAGYLSRVASQADGRRVRLELTREGRRRAEHVRRFRQAVFARAMLGWSAREREDFARLLTRFTDALAEEARSARG
jgi:DNA-binding MarR family transcriptional regulator